MLASGAPVFSSDGEKVGEDDIAEIHQGGELLKLDRAAAERLPEPAPNPAVMREDPADTGPGSLGEKLKRAWDYLSGKD